MATKKKNPADLTARNNNARKKENVALKKRVELLERKMSMLVESLKFLMLEEK